MVGMRGREKVLEIDTGADEECRSDYPLEARALIVIVERIVLEWNGSKAIKNGSC
jgi:hypothetical protein